MNKSVFTSICVIFFVPALFAAIPKQSSLSIEEVLTMPEQNRFILAQKKTDEYYPKLIQISKSPQQTLAMRWKALTLAAYLKKAKALPELQTALKSQEWFMRNAALIAIQSFDPIQAKNAAKELISDKALVVRSAAVDVLSKDLDPKTRELLWSELNASYNFKRKQSLWVRDQIISTLAIQPERNEIAKFNKILFQEDSANQTHALAALENLTNQKFGKKNASLKERKNLWNKWVKTNPEFKAL
jgi:HEAT repeat protein